MRYSYYLRWIIVLFLLFSGFAKVPEFTWPDLRHIVLLQGEVVVLLQGEVAGKGSLVFPALPSYHIKQIINSVS